MDSAAHVLLRICVFSYVETSSRPHIGADTNGHNKRTDAVKYRSCTASVVAIITVELTISSMG